MNWHPILKKQLEKTNVKESELSPELMALLDKVNTTYKEQDLSRYRLSNSLKISLQEMTRLYEQIQHKTQCQILESKLSTLGEMAAGLAHEINNPLTILDMHLQLIQQLKNSADFDKLLPEMSHTLERIKKIVHGLKTYSRNAAKDPLDPSDLKEIIDDTLALFQNNIRQQNINFKFNYLDNTVVNCRPSQISQIILNVVMNAADAMKNMKENWIEFRCEQDSSYYFLKILDNGPGIPKENIPHLLEPFFTTKEVGKGTGLGLSISKQIMEEHLGQFYFDPSEKNTCFVLKFKK